MKITVKNGALLLFGLSLCVNLSYADSLILGPISLSGDSPISENLYSSPCFKTSPIGTLYRSSTTEPILAVNPKNPNNMIISFQQDRFARFGGSGAGIVINSNDGGMTWSTPTPGLTPFTTCAAIGNSNLGSYTPYDRATNLWTTYDALGTSYLIGLPFDQDYLDAHPGGAVTTTSSTDGGANWSKIITVDKVQGKGYGIPALDKTTIAAHPSRPGLLYAVYSKFDFNSHALAMFSVSTNGGKSWSSPNVIFNPSNIGLKGYVEANLNVIAALNDGTLVDMLEVDDGTHFNLGVIRSTNDGKKWDSSLTVIANPDFQLAEDPEVNSSGVHNTVRASDYMMEMAKNKSNDYLYVAYQNTDPSTDLRSIYVSMSKDKGITWSVPKKVNQVATTNAFLPAIGVSGNGIVGVLYYDWRNDVLGDAALSTDAFFATFDADLNFRAETKLTASSFDMRKAALLNGKGSGAGSAIPGGYFLGDNFSVRGIGNDFGIAFTLPTGQGTSGVTPDPDNFVVDSYNRQNISFAKVSTSP